MWFCMSFQAMRFTFLKECKRSLSYAIVWFPDCNTMSIRETISLFVWFLRMNVISIFRVRSFAFRAVPCANGWKHISEWQILNAKIRFCHLLSYIFSCWLLHSATRCQRVECDESVWVATYLVSELCTYRRWEKKPWKDMHIIMFVFILNFNRCDAKRE